VAEDRVFSEDVAVGSVAEQRPKANGRVRRGGTVTLVLSKGPDRRAVPTIVGSTVPAAEVALKSVGLRKGTLTERFSNLAKGLVVATDPPVGQKVRPGTVVNLVVSRGPELLAVPNVQGKPEAEAKALVNKAGFKYTTVQVFSDTVPAGIVADQSPSSGRAPRGSSITLQVSKGPELVSVPDVRGRSRGEAVAQLEALGLRTRVIAFPGADTVRTQSPGPGEQVRKGTVVTLGVF
jgi:serine/threonine-protein kinase